MMAASEDSVFNGPNFAVICSFFDKFGDLCGISNFTIDSLQQMLEDTRTVHVDLIDLHVKLMRKCGRKNVTHEKWEVSLVKYCHSFSKVDAWEIERFGYKKSKLSVKINLLKRLLETQFDRNNRFKSAVNRFTSEQLRVLPIGKDVRGQLYWLQVDHDLNLRVYREDQDEETFELIVREREDLITLIENLESSGSLNAKKEEDSTTPSDTGESKDGEASQDVVPMSPQLEKLQPHAVNSAQCNDERKAKVADDGAVTALSLKIKREPAEVSLKDGAVSAGVPVKMDVDCDQIKHEADPKSEAAQLKMETGEKKLKVEPESLDANETGADVASAVFVSEARVVSDLPKIGDLATEQSVSIEISSAAPEQKKASDVGSQDERVTGAEKVVDSVRTERESVIKMAVTEKLGSPKVDASTEPVVTSVEKPLEKLGSPKVDVSVEPVVISVGKPSEKPRSPKVDASAEPVAASFEKPSGKLGSQKVDATVEPIATSVGKPSSEDGRVLIFVEGSLKALDTVVVEKPSSEVQDLSVPLCASKVQLDFTPLQMDHASTRRDVFPAGVSTVVPSNIVDASPTAATASIVRPVTSDVKDRPRPEKRIMPLKKREIPKDLDTNDTVPSRVGPVPFQRPPLEEVNKMSVAAVADVSKATCRETPIADVLLRNTDDDVLACKTSPAVSVEPMPSKQGDVSVPAEVPSDGNKESSEHLPTCSTIAAAAVESEAAAVVGETAAPEKAASVTDRLATEEVAVKEQAFLDESIQSQQETGQRNRDALSTIEGLLDRCAAEDLASKRSEPWDDGTPTGVEYLAPDVAREFEKKSFVASPSLREKDLDFDDTGQRSEGTENVIHTREQGGDGPDLETAEATPVPNDTSSSGNVLPEVGKKSLVSVELDACSSVAVDLSCTTACLSASVGDVPEKLPSKVEDEIMDVARTSSDAALQKLDSKTKDARCDEEMALAFTKSDVVSRVEDGVCTSTAECVPDADSKSLEGHVSRNELPRCSKPLTVVGAETEVDSVLPVKRTDKDAVSPVCVTPEEEKPGADVGSPVDAEDCTLEAKSHDDQLLRESVPDEKSVDGGKRLKERPVFEEDSSSVSVAVEGRESGPTGVVSKEVSDVRCDPDKSVPDALLVAKPSAEVGSFQQGERSAAACDPSPEADVVGGAAALPVVAGHEAHVENRKDVVAVEHKAEGEGDTVTEVVARGATVVEKEHDAGGSRESCDDEQGLERKCAKRNAERAASKCDDSKVVDPERGAVAAAAAAEVENKADRETGAVCVNRPDFECDGGVGNKEGRESRRGAVVGDTGECDGVNKVDQNGSSVETVADGGGVTPEVSCRKPARGGTSESRARAGGLEGVSGRETDALKPDSLGGDAAINSDENDEGASVAVIPVNSDCPTDDLSVAVGAADKCAAEETAEPEQGGKIASAGDMVSSDGKQEAASGDGAADGSTLGTADNSSARVGDADSSSAKVGDAPGKTLEGVGASEADARITRSGGKIRRPPPPPPRAAASATKKQDEKMATTTTTCEEPCGANERGGSSDSAVQAMGGSQVTDVYDKVAEESPMKKRKGRGAAVAEDDQPEEEPVQPKRSSRLQAQRQKNEEEQRRVEEEMQRQAMLKQEKLHQERKRKQAIKDAAAAAAAMQNGQVKKGPGRPKKGKIQVATAAAAAAVTAATTTAAPGNVAEPVKKAAKKKTGRRQRKRIIPKTRKKKPVPQACSGNGAASVRSKKKKGYKPWDVSSESSSSSSYEQEETSVEEMEESEEELVFSEGSDHEFSPESEQDNGVDEQPAKVKRARTVKKARSGSEDDSSEEMDDDTPCSKCEKYDHPEWILLCDKCNNGYHTSCLRPPLMLIPAGDWFCPPCDHKMLVERLQEQLKNLDQLWKKKEREEMRRKRLAYVGISLDNVLKPDKKDHEDGNEEDDEGNNEDAFAGSDDDDGGGGGDYVLLRKRSRRARKEVSYKFREFDELINSAIQDEPLVTTGLGGGGVGGDGGGHGKGKDISNITNVEEKGEEGVKEREEVGDKGKEDDDDGGEEEEEEEDDDEVEDEDELVVVRKKKKHRRLNDLDSPSDDDDSDEDFKGTSSESEPASEEESVEGAEETDESWDEGRARFARGGRSQPSSKRRHRTLDHDFINDDSEDSDVNRRTVRRAAAKKVSYKELSDSDEFTGHKVHREKSCGRRTYSKKMVSDEDSEDSDWKKPTKRSSHHGGVMSSTTRCRKSRTIASDDDDDDEPEAESSEEEKKKGALAAAKKKGSSSGSSKAREQNQKVKLTEDSEGSNDVPLKKSKMNIRDFELDSDCILESEDEEEVDDEEDGEDVDEEGGGGVNSGAENKKGKGVGAGSHSKVEWKKRKRIIACDDTEDDVEELDGDEQNKKQKTAERTVLDAADRVASAAAAAGPTTVDESRKRGETKSEDVANKETPTLVASEVGGAGPRPLEKTSGSGGVKAAHGTSDKGDAVKPKKSAAADCPTKENDSGPSSSSLDSAHGRSVIKSVESVKEEMKKQEKSVARCVPPGKLISTPTIASYDALSNRLSPLQPSAVIEPTPSLLAAIGRVEEEEEEGSLQKLESLAKGPGGDEPPYSERLRPPDFQSRPSPLKPSAVEPYPVRSSPSKLTLLDTYPSRSSPQPKLTPLEPYSGPASSPSSGGIQPYDRSRPSGPVPTQYHSEYGGYPSSGQYYPPNYPHTSTAPYTHSPPMQGYQASPGHPYSQYHQQHSPNYNYVPQGYNEQGPAPYQGPGQPPYGPYGSYSPPPAGQQQSSTQPNGRFSIDNLLQRRIEGAAGEDDEFSTVNDLVSYITGSHENTL